MRVLSVPPRRNCLDLVPLRSAKLVPLPTAVPLIRVENTTLSLPVAGDEVNELGGSKLTLKLTRGPWDLNQRYDHVLKHYTNLGEPSNHLK